jgi:hypothetical protein
MSSKAERGGVTAHLGPLRQQVRDCARAGTVADDQARSDTRAGRAQARPGINDLGDKRELIRYVTAVGCAPERGHGIAQTPGVIHPVQGFTAQDRGHPAVGQLKPLLLQAAAGHDLGGACR